MRGFTIDFGKLILGIFALGFVAATTLIGLAYLACHWFCPR